MKPNKILLCILAGCALISVMTVFPSNVLSSEIDSQAQISFQMPEYIPVEQQSINKMKSNQGTLVNAPVASGKYDRQFGYFSTRKEVIPLSLIHISEPTRH